MAEAPKRNKRGTFKDAHYDPKRDWSTLVAVHDTPQLPYGRHLTAKQNIAERQVMLVMPRVKRLEGAENIAQHQHALEGKGIPHDAFIFQGKEVAIYNPDMRSIATDKLIETGNVWYLLNSDVHPNTRLIVVRDKDGKFVTLGWETIRVVQKGEILTFNYGEPSSDWACVPHE